MNELKNKKSCIDCEAERINLCICDGKLYLKKSDKKRLKVGDIITCEIKPDREILYVGNSHYFYEDEYGLESCSSIDKLRVWKIK